MAELGITGMNAILLSCFVAGFVEMAKAVINREWYKVLVIVMAVISGAVGGLLLGLPLMTSICGGFAASGLVTIAQNVGKN